MVQWQIMGMASCHNLWAQDTTARVVRQSPSTMQRTDSDSVMTAEVDTNRFIAKPNNNSRTSLDLPVRYGSVDSLVLDLQQSRAYLYKDAHMSYGSIQLKAHQIEQDWKGREVTATTGKDSSGAPMGKPTFQDGDQTFDSERIRYNFRSKRASVSRLVTQDGELFMVGRSVRLNNDQSIYMKNTQMTTCSNTDAPHFYLNLSKAHIVPNKRVVSGPAYLVMAGVPLPVGLPFAIIPSLKGQRSGLLPPEYGRSPELGFFLRNLGYYFALSDYLDLTLRGDLYSLGSHRLSPALQYTRRYRYTGRVELSYSNQQRGDARADDRVSNRDFFIRWNHQQDAKAHPHRRFTASVTAGTSTFLSNNSFATTQFLQNQLNSSISYNQSFANRPFRLSLAARHNQNTQTKQINLTLPEGSFSMNRVEPFKRKVQLGNAKWYEKIGLTYQTNFRSTTQAPDSTFFSEALLRNFNGGVQHSLPLSSAAIVIARYLQFTPTFTYNERWSFRQLNRSYDDTANTIRTDTVDGFYRNYDYSFSLSVNTRIYGLIQMKRGRLAALRHVLNPRISYLWRPDFSNPTFGFFQRIQSDSLGNTRLYDRYGGFGYGGAGSGRSNAINFSLDNLIEGKWRIKTDTGQVMKKFKVFDSFGLNGTYNLAADSFKLSIIQLNGRTNFTDRLSMFFSASLDPYSTDDQGKRINRYRWQAQQGLTRLTSANFTINGSLRNRSQQANRTPSLADRLAATPSNDPREVQEREYLMRQAQTQFIDWEIPFQASFNLAVGLQKSPVPSQKDLLNAALDLNGDFNLTEGWKIAWRTGIDLVQKKLNPTMINVFRDLHCWEMSFNLVPFGTYRSYTFTLNAKGRTLQSLRLTRRRDWYDLNSF
ncbi:MAG: putative LPS assembly protein LptD [Bacteroidia bacterium]